jgi:hypothetical protein
MLESNRRAGCKQVFLASQPSDFTKKPLFRLDRLEKIRYPQINTPNITPIS